MTGPYPPQYGAGQAGSPIHQGPYPAQGQAQPYPDEFGTAYPGALPAPVPYPRRRRWPIVAAVVVALALLAGLITAIALSSGRTTADSNGSLTEASAKAAVQQYLDALIRGDNETVARHSLCGLFDAVKERRSDLALASLSSDAFRKQYRSAEVTSIDKMIRWSPTQAQVLFSMDVTPASGSGRGSGSSDEQAVAQLLSQNGQVFVCSYLPRTAGQY